MLKTYKVPVSWTVTATMEIEAESLVQAKLIAADASLPTDADYLEDSFQIDEELIYVFHPENDVVS